MTVSLKHTFQSAKADSGDATLIQPSNWNDEHTLTQATGRLLGRSTAGAGATEEITVGSGLSLSGGTLSASGGGLLQLPIQDNAYYYPYGSVAGGSEPIDETIIYALPIIFREVATFNRIGIEVFTQQSGGAFRAGIYPADATTMLPELGAAPLVNVELACTSPGEVEQTISFTPTEETLYWIAGIVNDPTVILTNATYSELSYFAFGSTGSQFRPAYVWRATGQTYGSLPNAPSGSLVATDPPMIWLRKV